MTSTTVFLEEMMVYTREGKFPDWSEIYESFSKAIKNAKSIEEKDSLFKCLFMLKASFENLVLEANNSTDLSEFREAFDRYYRFKLIQYCINPVGGMELHLFRPLIAQEIRAQRLSIEDELVTLAVKGYNLDDAASIEIGDSKNKIKLALGNISFSQIEGLNNFFTIFTKYSLFNSFDPDLSDLLGILFSVKDVVLQDLSFRKNEQEIRNFHETFNAYYASILLTSSFVYDVFSEQLYRQIIINELNSGRMDPDDKMVNAALSSVIEQNNVETINNQSANAFGKNEEPKKKRFLGIF